MLSWLVHGSGIIIITACGRERPPSTSNSRQLSNIAERLPSVTFKKILSPSPPVPTTPLWLCLGFGVHRRLGTKLLRCQKDLIRAMFQSGNGALERSRTGSPRKLSDGDERHFDRLGRSSPHDSFHRPKPSD